MRLFGRQKPRLETRPIPGRDDLVLVRSDQIDQLVRQWAEELFAAIEHESLPEDVLRLGC